LRVSVPFGGLVTVNARRVPSGDQRSSFNLRTVIACSVVRRAFSGSVARAVRLSMLMVARNAARNSGGPLTCLGDIFVKKGNSIMGDGSSGTPAKQLSFFRGVQYKFEVSLLQL